MNGPNLLSFKLVSFLFWTVFQGRKSKGFFVVGIDVGTIAASTNNDANDFVSNLELSLNRNKPAPCFNAEVIRFYKDGASPGKAKIKLTQLEGGDHPTWLAAKDKLDIPAAQNVSAKA